MKELITIILTFTILSCSHTSQNNASNVKDSLEISKPKDIQRSKSFDTIAIDYKENKDLLDIILLLPDSAFTGWTWRLNDRINWYKEIKANNYYIDKDSSFINQQYFDANKAGFTVVDGTWSINIYKTIENSYIVFTKNNIGDGVFLNYFEVKSNVIKKYIHEKTIFLNFEDKLKNKASSEYCDEKFKELIDPIFTFDLKNTNKVEIESAWYLTK